MKIREKYNACKQRFKNLSLKKKASVVLYGPFPSSASFNQHYHICGSITEHDGENTILRHTGL